MTRPVLVALRAVLALLFAASVACQIFSGSLAASVVDGAEITPLAGLIIAGALCIEVVLLAVWMLVSLVRTEAIFEEHGRADRWVNAAIGALVAAAVFAAAGFGYFLIVYLLMGGSTPTDLTLALIAASAAGISIALALLVVVMRRLLHTAIRLNSELAEVI